MGKFALMCLFSWVGASVCRAKDGKNPDRKTKSQWLENSRTELRMPEWLENDGRYAGMEGVTEWRDQKSACKCSPNTWLDPGLYMYRGGFMQPSKKEQLEACNK